jgi:subtilisin family serine protease
MKKALGLIALGSVMVTSSFGMVANPKIFRFAPELKASQNLVNLEQISFKQKDRKNFVSAEEAEVLKDWMRKSSRDSDIQGTATDAAIAKYGIGEHEVIVAVIDSGIDVNHPALKHKMWINDAEANGKEGVDDDGNGFVDDVHGWNFLGDVYDARIEAVKVYMDLTAKIRKGKKLSKSKKKLLKKTISAVFNFWGGADSPIAKSIMVNENVEYLVKAGGLNKTKNEITNKDLEKIAETTAKKKYALRYSLKEIKKYIGEDDVRVHLNNYKRYASPFMYGKYINTYFSFDPNFKPWDELNKQGKKYGNAKVSPIGSDEDHGTHVAGIIAADSEEMVGIAGKAKVKIMALRVVPNGDERDKDVANAIRYAVDNGAKVVNMSFGKGISSETHLVKKAIKYAARKGVLLVHAAGNDNRKIKYNNNFPNKLTGIRKVATNFLTVGASSFAKGEELVANFTNYSKTQVDIFAPGHKIYSAVLNDGYDFFSGTSMASPCAAGVATLILTHKPKMKPKKMIRLLRNTVNTYDKDLSVKVGDEMILFNSLSKSEGITDVENIFDKILK